MSNTVFFPAVQKSGLPNFFGVCFSCVSNPRGGCGEQGRRPQQSGVRQRFGVGFARPDPAYLWLRPCGSFFGRRHHQAAEELSSFALYGKGPGLHPRVPLMVASKAREVQAQDTERPRAPICMS